MIEWTAMLLCTEGVLDSYLSSQTNQPDWCFSWFFSVPLNKNRDSTSNYAIATSFHQIHYVLIIIQLYSVWATDGNIK